MINRRNTVYVELPEELVGNKKTKDAKAEISISLVIPKDMEKKGAQFIDDEMDMIAKDFRSFMKKRVKKILGKE